MNDLVKELCKKCENSICENHRGCAFRSLSNDYCEEVEKLELYINQLQQENEQLKEQVEDLNRIVGIRQKRKFDYAEFDDGAVYYDSDLYTEEEARRAYYEEYCYEKDDIEDVVVTEEYVKWKPHLSKDEMWLFDIFDNEDNRGMYLTCNNNDKRAFKCWACSI